MTTSRCKTILARLLAATAVVVAAFSLAPSLASAHAGHSHSALPAPQTVEIVAAPLLMKVAPDAPQGEVTIRQTTGQSPSLLQASPQKTPQSCPGGCCHSAGAGCCAISIPATFQILAPTLGRSAFVVVVAWGSGITPGALPEPPNSLV